MGISPSFNGDAVMIKKVEAAPNVEIRHGAKITKVFGDVFVKGIEVVREATRERLDVEGVFVEIGLIPNAECAAELRRNSNGEVIVDCHNQTSVEGVFAAGDVTNVPEKQIIIACGEGSKACLSAFRYLSTHTFT